MLDFTIRPKTEDDGVDREKRKEILQIAEMLKVNEELALTGTPKELGSIRTYIQRYDKALRVKIRKGILIITKPPRPKLLNRSKKEPA